MLAIYYRLYYRRAGWDLARSRVFSQMLANVYGRLSAAGPSAAGPSAAGPSAAGRVRPLACVRPGAFRRPSSIQVYIYIVCGLASLGKSIFFSLYTIYQSCHEPVDHAADAACSVSR